MTAATADVRAPRLTGPDPLAVQAARRARPMRTRVASWYGPGWYGRRTYCGQILTSKLLGIAHRTLPCGTKVRFSYRGRSIVARVVDRGHFPARIDYDVTWAVAKHLRILRIGIATLKADH